MSTALRAHGEALIRRCDFRSLCDFLVDMAHQNDASGLVFDHLLATLLTRISDNNFAVVNAVELRQLTALATILAGTIYVEHYHTVQQRIGVIVASASLTNPSSGPRGDSYRQS